MTQGEIDKDRERKREREREWKRERERKRYFEREMTEHHTYGVDNPPPPYYPSWI